MDTVTKPCSTTSALVMRSSWPPSSYRISAPAVTAHARSHVDIPQARPMAAAIAYALHAPSLMPADPAEVSNEPAPSESAIETSPTVAPEAVAPPPATP